MHEKSGNFICLSTCSFLEVQSLPTPHPSVRTGQNQARQPGILPKAAPGALKEKEAQKESSSSSSSSSDSEDETDLTASKLPAPPGKKTPAPLVLMEGTFYFQRL